MLIQMLSPSVIALVLAIGVAPEKALPALVAQAGENKNNAKAKEEKKIKVEFEENYVNVNGELALVGKISISSNIDSVYEEIMQEAKKRIIVVIIRDDLLNPKYIHVIDKKTGNFIKNSYFEKISDCKIKLFDEIEIFSTLEKDAWANKNLEINKKLMDVIKHFEKLKNKEGIIEIKFSFILPAFRL
ncbi:MAG: hypothetical protein NTV50_14330 [Planctomycetota bacterium]|nr:hypothetical protein [Planctomycetota bacterium]